MNSAEASALVEDVLCAGGEISFSVHGGSMRPFLEDGDSLTVVRCQARNLTFGDIILYRDETRRLVAHRIVGRTPSRVITCGDSPGSIREEIAEDRVVGLVVAARRGKSVRNLRSIKWRTIGFLWVLLPRQLRALTYPATAIFNK